MTLPRLYVALESFRTFLREKGIDSKFAAASHNLFISLIIRLVRVPLATLHATVPELLLEKKQLIPAIQQFLISHCT